MIRRQCKPIKRCSLACSRTINCQLISNISTKSKPDGGALKSIIERWAVLQGNQDISGEEVHRLLLPLEKHVSSYDFSKVRIRHLSLQ